MKNLILSKKELATPVDESLLPYKTLIEIFRKDEYSHFRTVRQSPLSKIFSEANIPADLGTRASLLKALKHTNFLECEGNLTGMKYRLKETEIKKDALLLATELKDLTQKILKESRKQNHNKIKLNTVDEKKLSSTPVTIKKTYALGEYAFLMKDDKIFLGKIISLKYETSTQTSEDYPRVQLPPIVNTEKILATVLIDEKTVHTTSVCNLYPQIDLLLKALQVKYEKNNTLPVNVK